MTSSKNQAASQRWLEENQRRLMESISVVRTLLEGRVEGNNNNRKDPVREPVFDAENNSKTALELLCTSFRLSAFERDILLLCAGIELDSQFLPLCAAIHGDLNKTYPTFSLALAVLPQAHWSALSPGSPLRYWKLIELQPADSLVYSPLRINERILHYLTGVQVFDVNLSGFIYPIPISHDLIPTHHSIAKGIVEKWSSEGRTAKVFQLCGNADDIYSIFAAACGFVGLHPCKISAHDIPVFVADRENFMRLWEREVALSRCALLIYVDEDANESVVAAIRPFVHRLSTIVVIGTRHSLSGLSQVLSIDVNRPTVSEQTELWKQSLGALADRINGQIGKIVTQFELPPQTIFQIGSRVSCNSGLSNEDLRKIIWDECRLHTGHRLDMVAQRIHPVATWGDLVLPKEERMILHDIAACVRQRYTTHETWGFARKSSRGLSITALFCGSSGTGKTMAAEVIANELRLDLYRIDLSQVVSKYIGETEKNLRRVFDAAEGSGVILLFDEADALFGKRSEVKDSHDRYANIEISYLLQRLEAYQGLAILTTNMRDALDQAFLRRIRFVVQFPFPDAVQREEIWQHIFPKETPVDGLDYHQLARLNVSGGNIRNMALYSAYLAADADEPVRMSHLARAAHVEYTKLEKTLTTADFGERD